MDGDRMKELVNEMNVYMKWLLNLAKTNPQKARKIALQNLHKTGIYDKEGNLVSH